MSSISLKSVVDSCGLSIVILISRIRFTSFILECTPVFTIFIWLKHCSTVAIPIGNFNKMSRRLKVFQQLVAYVFNVIISTFSLFCVTSSLSLTTALLNILHSATVSSASMIACDVYTKQILHYCSPIF